ncbi:MAG: hypothetical protein QNJ44_01790 [Rhodobacter sp.]|nr:hypothetical protein [Rhodobacter sp.]
MRRSFAALTGLVLAAACSPPAQPVAGALVSEGTGSGPPQVLVAARGGVGPDGLPLPLPPCTITGSPVEITISVSDPDGLALVRIAHGSGGIIQPGSLRVTPAGQDVSVRRRGAPGDELVELVFAGRPVPRTGTVASFATAAPHSGTVSVAATDRKGATARVGIFRLARPGQPDGCQPAG